MHQFVTSLGNYDIINIYKTRFKPLPQMNEK